MDRELRLAELIAGLSLATDLGMGQPMEHALRSCLLAVRLGESLGLDEAALADVYYVGLLRWIGCTSHAAELSAWFGDEIAAQARAATFDFGSPADVLLDVVRHAGEHRPPLARLRALAAVLAGGRGTVEEWFRASCEVAQHLAGRLGFGPGVQRALGHVFERWDGGGPRRVAGEAIALPARLLQVAADAEVFHRLGGTDAAAAVVRRRAGRLYDPALAARFQGQASRLLADIGTGSSWEAVLAAEPGVARRIGGDEVDAALGAVADFVDLKSPYTAGHSRGVAELAAAAGSAAGLPAPDVALTRRAGLLHDLGRTGVPNGIWDKPGPLTDGEWERVRLHTYYTERVLARSPALARLGSLASLHHERLDGSGYHRGLPAAALPPVARLLAAADVYHALTEPRPHRPARTPEAAADVLRAEVRAGRLDGQAADAVLRAAGHRVRRRREWPAGLSPREIEVLRLVARAVEPGDRAPPGHLAEYRRPPRPPHLRQDRRLLAPGGDAVRDRARPARRSGGKIARPRDAAPGRRL